VRLLVPLPDLTPVAFANDRSNALIPYFPTFICVSWSCISFRVFTFKPFNISISPLFFLFYMCACGGHCRSVCCITGTVFYSHIQNTMWPIQAEWWCIWYRRSFGVKKFWNYIFLINSIYMYIESDVLVLSTLSGLWIMILMIKVRTCSAVRGFHSQKEMFLIAKMNAITLTVVVLHFLIQDHWEYFTRDISISFASLIYENTFLYL